MAQYILKNNFLLNITLKFDYCLLTQIISMRLFKKHDCYENFVALHDNLKGAQFMINDIF